MTSFRKVAALLTALAGTTLVSAAHAQSAPADAAETPQGDGKLGNHQKNVRLDAGVRAQLIKGAGFDPFSEKDMLPQLSLGASWAFWARDALSLAAVVGFDYGQSSADARSARADLNVARFSLAPEVRYHVLRVLALTAKAGPTLTRESVELSGGLDSSLTKASWKGGVDATAGVAVELFGYASGKNPRPRLWATVEGGYGWTSPMKLELKPDSPGSVPQRLVAPALADLSLAGPLLRVTAALSF